MSPRLSTFVEPKIERSLYSLYFWVSKVVGVRNFMKLRGTYFCKEGGWIPMKEIHSPEFKKCYIFKIFFACGGLGTFLGSCIFDELIFNFFVSSGHIVNFQ